MKHILTILLISSVFLSKAQYGFDGIHDERALEKLILNYLDNGVIKFTVNCQKCGSRNKNYHYQMINDSILVETNGSDELKFIVKNNQIRWFQTKEDSLYIKSLPKYITISEIDSLGCEAQKSFKIEQGDTILSSMTYTVNSKDSSVIEKHIISYSDNDSVRKTIVYSYSSDSTRKIIYKKVSNNWIFFKDVTSWTDSIMSNDQIVIKEFSLNKTNFFGRTPPEIVETKNLLQTSYFLSEGIITKIELFRSDLNLISNDEYTELIEIKPKIIKSYTPK